MKYATTKQDVEHAQRNEMRPGIKKFILVYKLRKPEDVLKRRYAEKIFARNVDVANRTRHVQPIKRNVLSVQKLVITMLLKKDLQQFEASKGFSSGPAGRNYRRDYDS